MKRLVGFFCALLALLCAHDARAQAANVTISFSPTTIAAGGTSTLQININNPQSLVAVSGGTITAFSYAAGVVNATDPPSFFGCGAASVNATPGAGSMSASNIDIGFLGTCSIFVTVTAAAGGTYTTTFPPGGFVGSTGSNPTSSEASLAVNQFVVTNTNDSGPGSLRQAILDTISSCPAGITFNIPGSGTQIIKPTTVLPTLSCALMAIDGFTQPGSAPNSALPGFDNAVQVIAVDGSLCGGCSGLSVTAPAVGVRGLQVLNFAGQGVAVNDTSFAGSINLTGNRMTNNVGNGVRVDSGSVQLGDGTAAGQNVIASNSAPGVVVAGGDLRVHYNIVENNTGRGILFLGGGGEVFNSFVRGNGLSGIVVTTVLDVVIMGTASYGNGGPGIDLNGDGPTLNDEAAVPYDTDSGPNQLLNYPVVTSVAHIGADTKIDGYWKTAAFSFPGTVELWENGSSGPPTEGQTKIGSLSLGVDANGFGTFSVTLPGTFSIVSAQVTIDTCGDGCVVSSEFSPKAVVSAPALTVSPTSLTFAQQQVGTTSAGQTVTLTNTGTSTLNISSIGNTGDFTHTHDCGATLAPSATCTITVKFMPASGGNLAGALTIQSDAASSPDTVSLAGVGVEPPTLSMAFSPSSITLGNTSTLTTTITNANTVSATNIAVNITHSTNLVNAPVPNATTTCRTGSATSAAPGGSGSTWTGLSVAAGGSCTIAISLTTSATGTFTATISAGAMTSDQGSSAANVQATLTVTAAPAPALSLNVSSIDFGSVTVGSTSATQDIVITNTGTAPLTIGVASVTGEFGRAAAPRCDGVVLAPSATCIEKVFFAPLSVGAKAGTWSVTSDAPGSPHSVSLSGTGTAVPVPAATVSPTSLTFAAQTIGTTSASQPVTLQNTGTANLNISSIGTTGDFGQTNACPAFLAPAASCTINVTFTPLLAGGRVGELKILHDASGSPSVVSLSGTGTPAPVPVATVSPSSLTFATQTVGTTSAAQPVTLQNTGTTNLAISSIATTTADFAQTNACPASLAPGNSCTINVTFTPAAPGGRVGELKIFHDASGSPSIVSLSGTALAAPAPLVALSSTSVAFPDTEVGATSATKVIVLTNTGNAPLDVASVVGSSGQFPFTTSCVGTIAPSGSCDISIQFAPGAVGHASGSISIFSNASGSPHAISLSGTGIVVPVGLLVASPASLAFPDTVAGTQSAALGVTLTNAGTATVVVSSIIISGRFTVSGSCATLAPGASCELSVRFAPNAPGTLTGTLTVQSDTSPVTVALSGAGVPNPLPEATLSATSVGFGNRFVAAPSPPMSVTLTNTGLSPLVISGIFTTGDFSAGSTCPATLAPGASCTITVRMLARLAGARFGALRVVTNAAGSPALVELSGTGCTPWSMARARLGLGMSCAPGS
jgi:hypothetical protein